MSIAPASLAPAPAGPACARARETLWRLGALALAHPAPEFLGALRDGSFHAALDEAWGSVTGRPWPRTAPPGDFAAFEAGYIAAFLHGRKGKPVASLLAGDHGTLLAGLSRPVFMLNVAAFYRHFGLTAATGDEGRADEPDHLAAMMEFMAVLCHLEAGALSAGRDPAPPRRAQRDFLARYLAPMLEAVTAALGQAAPTGLDPAIARMLDMFAPWARGQVAELEAQVGGFRNPDAAPAPRAEPAPQNLWD